MTETMPPYKIEHPITFDGTLVIIQYYHSNMWDRYNEWVINNCSGMVCSQNSGANNRLFVFENPEDAIAFKLRWV